FSSRRRHTRFSRDWSSDVCSSDLNSKLHIDLISHWEYIYLRDKNLRLIFKTDNSNRIGIYGNDFEEGSSKLKKENKTIDLIQVRSEEHTSELQSRENLVCRLLLEK